MFTHNVEAEIFERHAEVARGPMRLVWQNQARKMRRFEGDCLRFYRSVIAVSARDADVLARDYQLQRVRAIQTGVDLDFYPFTAPKPAAPGGGRIVFCGAMDSRSNIDGVKWLASDIWPLVAASRPQAEALIVGRNPGEDLVGAIKAQGLRFSFTGFVDDIRPHVASADVSVIPLRVGSGTRIKAFEAMALGRPVVATSIGIEGLDVTDGAHYRCADTPEAFAVAIVELLDQATMASEMAHAARALLEEHFSWRHIARQFEQICLEALA